MPSGKLGERVSPSTSRANPTAAGDDQSDEMHTFMKACSAAYFKLRTAFD